MSFSVPFHSEERGSSADTNFGVLTAVAMKFQRLSEHTVSDFRGKPSSYIITEQAVVAVTLETYIWEVLISNSG